MAYEPRTFQSTTTNTPPTGTDPMVDNTASGDVQAIKLINPTAGSVAPWIAQAARAQSLPVALSTEDAALLSDLLTITAFTARVGEVQASPTANTVLARLKDLLTGIVLATGTNNIGDVDVLTLPNVTLDAATLAALETINAAQSGTWTVQPGNTQNTTPWLVKEGRSATATTTSVADTAVSTTLLASNANRLGATIYNDSTVALYLKLGATASLTSFTVKMAADGYYEVPFGYTGIIDGIWASDASGSARIVELT